METITTDSINEFIQSKGGSVSVSELVTFLTGSKKIVCGNQDITAVRNLEKEPPRQWTTKATVIDYLSKLNGKRILVGSWDEHFTPHIIQNEKQVNNLISKISSEKYRDSVELRTKYQALATTRFMNNPLFDDSKGWYLVFDYSNCADDCTWVQIQIR